MADEFKDLIDRSRSKVEALAVREVAGPLLREIVNHGSNALARSASGAAGGDDVDVAPLFLYHQSIEVTDGIQVLVEEACSRAATPLLRSLFETLVSIEYMLSEDASFKERSLAWYVGFLHGQLDECDRFDVRTPQGLDVEKYWKGFHSKPLNMATPEWLDERRKALQGRLEMPHLAPIEEIWAARAVSRRPKWYSLDSRANDLRSLLASQLPHRVPDYDLLYRPWSGMAHAEDPTNVVTAHDGHAAFWPIRFPRDLAFVARMAASDAIAATRLILKKYRPGESGSVGRWYFSQVKPHLDRLEELHHEAWK